MPTLVMPDLSTIFPSSTAVGGAMVAWATPLLIFTFSFIIFLGLYKLIRRKTHGAAASVLGMTEDQIMDRAARTYSRRVERMAARWR